jgi:hypothetical protein
MAIPAEFQGVKRKLAEIGARVSSGVAQSEVLICLSHQRGFLYSFDFGGVVEFIGPDEVI